MKIILTGATGFVGQEVIKQLLVDTLVNEVILLVRKSTGIINPKLQEFVLKDFFDYAEIAQHTKLMLVSGAWVFRKGR